VGLVGACAVAGHAGNLAQRGIHVRWRGGNGRLCGRAAS
jgi:hypothetical protein